MVGDDACSVCASLIQKLLEFISNMERNKQYRKDAKPPKKPKIKTGKLSKKNFEKLQQLGMSFEYLPVSKNLMLQFEAAMKKMGGTFFTGGIEDNNSVYVAIPAAQRNMAALAAQHMLSKEIEIKPDGFILKDGNNKIGEEEMKITSDVMNSYDIPLFAFKTDDGKYMTVVPKEFEGQYNKAMEDVRQQLNEINNIDVVRYDQLSPLDKPEFAAYIITDEEAQELAKLAEFGELDIKFAKTEQGTAVFYSTDISEKITTAREEYAKSLSESEQYRIDVTDNTISMDIKNLLVPELSDENTYFLRVPNTSGKDYIRLDKSECEIINGGKSIKTELDMKKNYSIYDSEGNIKQSRSGEELSKSYNTRHPHATKGTKVYEYGQGRERVNLFDKEKDEIKTFEYYSLKKGPPQPCTAAVPFFLFTHKHNSGKSLCLLLCRLFQNAHINQMFHYSCLERPCRRLVHAFYQLMHMLRLTDKLGFFNLSCVLTCQFHNFLGGVRDIVQPLLFTVTDNKFTLIAVRFFQKIALFKQTCVAFGIGLRFGKLIFQPKIHFVIILRKIVMPAFIPARPIVIELPAFPPYSVGKIAPLHISAVPIFIRFGIVRFDIKSCKSYIISAVGTLYIKFCKVIAVRNYKFVCHKAYKRPFHKVYIIVGNVEPVGDHRYFFKYRSKKFLRKKL